MSDKIAQGMKQTKKQIFWEIVRFLLVGGASTIVDYIIFYIFRQWILPVRLIDGRVWDIVSLILATAVGFVAGLMVSWMLSVRFVFQEVSDKKEAHSKKSFMLFALIGFVGLLMTELGVVVLVQVLPMFTLFGVTNFLGMPWKEWLAKLIMTWLVIVWNYLGRKFFIFKS